MSRLDRWTILIFACVMAFFIGVAIARAEFYGAGDVLWTTYAGPDTDGTWIQKHLPSRNGVPAVRQTKESMTWDVGAGYRFSDGAHWSTNLWSIEAGYRHYGSGVSAGGLAVSDHLYGMMMRGEMEPGNVKSSEYEATDHLQGGYLRLSKGFHTGYGLEPYLSGGIEVLYHDLNFWTKTPNGRMQYGGFTGMLAGPTVGGGIKYALYKGVRVRMGAESHWMMTESGHPISSQWVTVGGGIEVPFVW